jgi:hypothetical protein
MEGDQHKKEEKCPGTYEISSTSGENMNRDIVVAALEVGAC